MEWPDLVVYGMFATMVLCVVFLCIHLPKEAAKKRKAREQYLTWALTRAIEIARYQQWVSPHRLRNQAHMTQSQAQEILLVACQREILYQAVNGRYYLKQ